MEASKISASETREFIALLKRLDEEEQAGLLLMLQGARNKRDSPQPSL